MRTSKNLLFLSLAAGNLFPMEVGAQIEFTASEQECVDDVNRLEEIGDNMNITKNMLDAFNATCEENGKCTASAVPGTAVTKNDYTSLVTSNSLGKMENACNNIVPDATLCLVTNEILKGGLKTFELNKPVCVPPSCDMQDYENIRFVDPNPSSCDPTSTADPCEILSSSVMCPETRNAQQFDAALCGKDAKTIDKNRGLNPFRSALRNSVVRACISVLLGQESPLCEITTPLVVLGTKDFTDFDSSASDEYKVFEDKCLSGEHSTSLCRMSAHLSARESESFIDIETDLIYTQIPLCLPNTCLDEDPMAIAYEELVKGNFKCDSITSFCEVEISDFTCETNQPPDSNTTPEPPTISISIPTQEEEEGEESTSQPTVAASFKPTIKTSEAPSLIQSITPTIIASMAPTVEISASPVEAESTAPSSMPRISTFPPTIRESTEPSNVIVESVEPSNMVVESNPLDSGESVNTVSEERLSEDITSGVQRTRKIWTFEIIFATVAVYSVWVSW